MYSYDENAALSAGKTGERITELGAYTGHFTMVEHLVNDKTGSIGMGFHFESDQGQTAYFYMNMIKKDGTDNEIGSGHRSALMNILQARTLKPADAIREKRDFDTKKTIKVKTQVFNELANKHVGVVFGSRDEEYQGKVIKKLDHMLFFAADSWYSAAELIEKKVEAKDVDSLVARLKHRLLSGGRGGSAGAVPSDYVPNEPAGDDGIPF